MSDDRPGVDTPWPEVNRLLSPDERFHGEAGWLLAPRSVERMQALLFVCSDNEINVKVSARAIRSIELVELDEQIVEVGAGVEIGVLERRLYDEGFELGWNTDPFVWQGVTVGEALTSFWAAGARLEGVAWASRLLAVELLSRDGGAAWVGRRYPAEAGVSPWLALASQDIHLVAARFRVHRRPPDRGYSVSKGTAGEMWRKWLQLRRMPVEWERLDLVLSRRADENAFLFAQAVHYEGRHDESCLVEVDRYLQKSTSRRERLSTVRPLDVPRGISYRWWSGLLGVASDFSE